MYEVFSFRLKKRMKNMAGFQKVFFNNSKYMKIWQYDDDDTT